MNVRRCLSLILAGLLFTAACRSGTENPSATPTQTVASPTQSPSTSPSASSSLKPEDPPWQKKLDEGIDDFLHNNYQAAVTALQDANKLNPSDSNAVFWLYRSYEKLETTHNRHSDSYVYALKVVALAPGTSQAKAAQDYISSIDTGQVASATPGQSRARDVGEMFSGYTTVRMSLVDLDGKRYAGLQFAHERNPDTNAVLLTPSQWTKFVTLYSLSLKKWKSVQEKRVQVGSIDQMALSLQNKSGATILEIEVTDPQTKASNTLVLDSAQAGKFGGLMDKVTEELRPFLPHGNALPSVGPGAAAPPPQTPPPASGSPAAAAASPAAASPAPH